MGRVGLGEDCSEAGKSEQRAHNTLSVVSTSSIVPLESQMLPERLNTPDHNRTE